MSLKEFTSYQQVRLQEMSERINDYHSGKTLLKKRLQMRFDHPKFPSPRGISFAAQLEYGLRKTIRSLLRRH